MKNLFISINRRRNFLMQPSLLNHLYTPQLYFPYLIKHIYSHRYRDSKRKIHLREWNRNFPTFPNSIVPLETKSISFITQPTTTQTLRNCIGVARTKSNSPQSARSGVQSFVTTSTIFLVVAFGQLIYSASVRVTDRYNWSSVRESLTR